MKKPTKVLSVKCAACLKEFSMVWEPEHEKNITDAVKRIDEEHLKECPGPTNTAFDEVLE